MVNRGFDVHLRHRDLAQHLTRGHQLLRHLIEPLRDDRDNILGTTSVAVDVSERKSNEDQLRLLLRELTHRCKNLLAVIHAIARQTASRTRSVEDFLDRFSARLVAIGASHDLLIADDWHGASLRMLVEQQLGDHADRFGDQIAIEGEDVMLKPEAVQNLGLALHELATNALKHGALKGDAGRLDISWQVRSEGVSRTLALDWRESGIPNLQKPTRTGFGTELIEKALRFSLRARSELTFRDDGVSCHIELTLPQRGEALGGS